MKWLYRIFAIVVLIASASCEREIDFNYRDIDPINVIEARLTSAGITVVITRTTPMDEPMDLTRVTDAEVVLIDLTSGVTTELTVESDGSFSSAVGGVVGHKYRLTVNIGTDHYQAESEMFPATEILDLKFNWIKMPYDDVAVLQCSFSDDAAIQGDCYWIKIYRNGKIYRWSELDDRGAGSGEKVATFMTSRRDIDEEDDEDVLLDGDLVKCSVEQISQAMHDYLEALQNDSNGPAMFTGDFCLGYFTANDPVETSIIFHPDEIPYY